MKTRTKNMHHRSGLIPVALVIIIGLVAAILVGIAWWYSVEKNQQEAIVNTAQQIINQQNQNANAAAKMNANTNAGSGLPVNQALGGDRDEYGCIGSAGYTWCTVKEKCIRQWEESCL